MKKILFLVISVIFTVLSYSSASFSASPPDVLSVLKNTQRNPSESYTYIKQEALFEKVKEFDKGRPLYFYQNYFLPKSDSEKPFSTIDEEIAWIKKREPVYVQINEEIFIRIPYFYEPAHVFFQIKLNNLQKIEYVKVDATKALKSLE